MGQPLGPVLQEDTWPGFIQTYSGARSNVAKHAWSAAWAYLFHEAVQRVFRNFCMAFIPLYNVDTTGPLPATRPVKQQISFYF